MKSTMNTDGKTGYPSVDKPWLKYYSEEAIRSEPFIGSIYEHIKWKNINYLGNPELFMKALSS